SPSIISGSFPPTQMNAFHRLPPHHLRTIPSPQRASVPYTLAHLSTASPQTLTYLSSFFSALEVPPTLHCVRCHKGYFDVENTDPDRSCLVGHDDDSAEVERVGKGAGYETLFGCCGKTVVGAGDMGPPDGRGDAHRSSCARLNCHDPLGSARKRSRRVYSDDSDPGVSHSSVRTRSRTSKRACTVPCPSSDRHSDDEDMPLSVHASPKSAAARRKPRAKSVPASALGSVRGKSKASAKPRSKAIHFSDPPASPSKKPQASRLAPAPSFVSTTSTTSTSMVTASASRWPLTSTSTVIAAPTKTKRAMQPKTKPRQPKEPKRLTEVVGSSMSEIA
ncbi:hypothetical protein C8R46DRAFT_1095541, partial [Mycena filopes]